MVRCCRRLKSDAVGDPKSALVGFHMYLIWRKKRKRLLVLSQQGIANGQVGQALLLHTLYVTIRHKF